MPKKKIVEKVVEKKKEVKGATKYGSPTENKKYGVKQKPRYQ